MAGTASIASTRPHQGWWIHTRRGSVRKRPSARYRRLQFKDGCEVRGWCMRRAVQRDLAPRRDEAPKYV